jgi:hypothetical protein
MSKAASFPFLLGPSSAFLFISLASNRLMCHPAQWFFFSSFLTGPIWPLPYLAVTLALDWAVLI